MNNHRKFTPALLAAALLIACTGTASAQQADAAAEKQLAEARKQLAEAQKQLAEAAKRVTELSRDLNVDAAENARRMAELSLLRGPVIGVALIPDETAGVHIIGAAPDNGANKTGVRIGGITPGSGADKAGLKAGDRITRVGDKEVTGDTTMLRLANAQRLLRELEEGKPAKIGYVRDGRNATVSVIPSVDSRVFVFQRGDGVEVKLGDDKTGKPQMIDGRMIEFAPEGNLSLPGGSSIVITRDKDGTMMLDGKRIDIPDTGNLAEMTLRLGTDPKRISTINGKNGFTIEPLVEAFRWSGLNLAALEPQLGRYFGTDSGVLVISAGNDLQGLQAGDVIQKIDGKAVNTPREAMTALRAKPADSNVDVEYLRDHKTVRAQIKVPKAASVQLFPPSAPTPPSVPTPPASN
jgi:membrane-associated protease RseP (regulator of RpoE activity)